MPCWWALGRRREAFLVVLDTFTMNSQRPGVIPLAKPICRALVGSNDLIFDCSDKLFCVI